MNSQQVLLRLVRGGGVWVAALGVLAGVSGCGDGGSTTAASTEPQAQTITQSDIVLPSSVQVVTAK